jgi:hypothetical protein
MVPASITGTITPFQGKSILWCWKIDAAELAGGHSNHARGFSLGGCLR